VYRKEFLIYVVDDEPVIASTLAQILILGGYFARPFTDPLDALEAARFESPDLLLSDLVMPGMSGVELGVHVSHHCPTCRVLLISARRANQDEMRMATMLGYNFENLLKPASPFAILARVREFHAERDRLRSAHDAREVEELS
jgi:DNA-binding response OmpR family regulator